jgi:beta-lactamase class A
LKINKFNIYRWVAIVFIVLAAILLVIQLFQFSRIRAGFAPGTQIGGIPVGGLNQQQAAERITQAFNFPIELKYEGQIIQVKPSQLGFTLDVDAMIAMADQQRVTLPFWSSFWDYLWNRKPVARNTPLQASVDEKQLRIFLMDEISSRYDQIPQASIPIPGSINFQYGEPGKVLDIERTISIVEEVLRNPSSRSVEMIVSEVTPPRPSLDNLEVMIKQIIDRSKFDGLTEVYVLDLNKREEINFAYERGVDIEPGIAFSAHSTIKIPIMVSVFRRIGEPTPQGVADLMQQMIKKSENPPADTLMESYLDPNIGPIFITSDMRQIGLKNTFLGAHFYLGAAVLDRFITPANQRLDYDADPDFLNQTTTADLSMLLDDIYQCAQTGGGTFAAVYEGDITQSECQLMITFLSQNKTGALLEAGLPDGTQFANKHGWVVETDGVIHTIINTGIVFSPGNNYVVTIAMYQPTQLIYDVANVLYAQLSSAIYNYFNIK